MLYIEPGDAARTASAQHIAQLASDPEVGLEAITAGLLDLSMFLLFNLAKAENAEGGTEGMIQKAQEILQTISMRKFPEAE